jgi:hypothetical protein
MATQQKKLALCCVYRLGTEIHNTSPLVLTNQKSGSYSVVFRSRNKLQQSPPHRGKFPHWITRSFYQLENINLQRVLKEYHVLSNTLFIIINIFSLSCKLIMYSISPYFAAFNTPLFKYRNRFYCTFIIIIIIISGSTVLVRTLATSHRRFRNLF